MSIYKEVEPIPNFPELERTLLEHWYKNGVVTEYLHKNDASDKKFFFQDGPITANNPMGVHHAWGRTYKDLWQRFKNMQGYKQRFQNGFDCQGLWVEVEVEKELGFKSKKDIESFGVARFIELCKERVKKYSKIQTDQSIKLGYLMDWDNSYYTMSDENNYMIWHFLKKCHEEGYIYKGHDSVPWCYRCGTAISQHEMLTEDYKTVTHDSVYIAYPVTDANDTYLLAWTTTPWTLPGNVAIAVDPIKEYALTTGSMDGNKYYVIKTLAESLGLVVERTLKGEELVGLHYESPFDSLPRVQKTFGDYRHVVIAADAQILEISAVEGTGLVHIAPGAGTEDFKLSKLLHLPVIDLIDEGAVYLDDLGDFSGKNAKVHPDIILDYLKTHDGGKFLFDIKSYTHRYPACWRCKAELVWRVVDEWYIGMDRGARPLRARLKKVAEKINWIPSFGLDRELDWLNNMHDWLISKKRYWGLALPIWVCDKCEHFEVVGGEDDLKSKAVQGLQEFEGHTPHKPHIDGVKLKCRCGSLMSRIPDVGNPWLDAGIVPFSTLIDPTTGKVSYTSDKSYWKEWFPADFITESFPGQFKNWFYSLITMSTVLEDTNSFESVLGYASMLAEDGRPMHKSWGNSIEFSEGADKIGVDVMRWAFAKHNPERNLLFGYKMTDEVRRQFNMLLWNSYRFFVNYAAIEKFSLDEVKEYKPTCLDSWILSRLDETIVVATTHLEKYDAFTAASSIEGFVQDLSLWYIRRSRDRVGPSAADPADKITCYTTLHKVFETLSRLLMPFTPFLADTIYTNVTGNKSVNLASWPEPNQSIDTLLIQNMVLVRKVCEVAHARRKEANIPVRQPLASLTMLGDINSLKNAPELWSLIKAELNVKELFFTEAAGDLQIVLDLVITEDLELEGLARDFVRSVQALRKEQKTLVSEQIDLEYKADAKLQKAISVHEMYIKNKAGLKSLQVGESFRILD